MMRIWDIVMKHRVKSLIAAKLVIDSLYVFAVVHFSSVKTEYIETETAHVMQYNVNVVGLIDLNYHVITEKTK